MDKVSVLFSCDKAGKFKACRVYLDDERATDDHALLVDNGDRERGWLLQRAELIGKRKRSAKA